SARTFQFLDGDRLLVLNIAESFVAEGSQIMLVRALPGVIVRRSEALQVIRRSREREHGNWLTHPYTMFPQIFLECAHLAAFIMLGQNEVRLHPRNPLPRIDEKLTDPLSRNPAVLV